MKSLVLLFFVIGCSQLHAFEQAIEKSNNSLVALNPDFSSSSSALSQESSTSVITSIDKIPAIFHFGGGGKETEFFFDYQAAAVFWLFAPIILGVLILGHRYLSVVGRS